jgi:hypothetical protein
MLAARHRDETEGAMRRFLAKHVAATTGTLSCFDRLLFKGHLPLRYPHAMEEFLSRRGIVFKDLKGFVLKQAERLKVHAHAVAEQAGRPYEYFESPVQKDQRARAIATRDGITEGLVCVFGTIEPCRSFRLAYGHGRPTIRPAWRTCLFLYCYFLDREVGFCHARVQTWFPFTMQVYVNGHEWLARQMDKRGLRYRRLENAFWIKMYDKHGCVLRVETVINDPDEFTVRRRAGRRGRRTLGGHPLPKGVAFLPRYATVSAAANHRYRDALAGVDDPAPAHQALDRLVRTLRDPHGRASRACNPATAPDAALFAAVLRGEHLLQGFRNRDVRLRLFGPPAATVRRRSAQVSRRVKRLHLRGLVATIPRSRRWRITQLGHTVLRAAIRLREEDFPSAFLKTAA